MAGLWANDAWQRRDTLCVSLDDVRHQPAVRGRLCSLIRSCAVGFGAARADGRYPVGLTPGLRLALF